jgi:hypothetical protein
MLADCARLRWADVWRSPACTIRCAAPPPPPGFSALCIAVSARLYLSLVRKRARTAARVATSHHTAARMHGIGSECAHPSRRSMKSATSWRMPAAPRESEYAPTDPMCPISSCAREIASAGKSSLALGFARRSGDEQSAMTWRLKVRGFWPSCCGLPTAGSGV